MLSTQVQQKRVVSGEVDVTEIVYPDGHQLQRHIHTRPMFCYAVRGGYRESAAGRTFDAGRGSVVYLPPGEVHHDAVGQAGLHAIRVEVEESLVADIPGLADRGPALLFGNAGWYARALVDELGQDDALRTRSLESLAALVLVEVARRPPPRETGMPVWIQRVRERICEEYAHPPTLEDLARDVDRHPSHVARAFRSAMNCTIGEYVRARRLAAARDLIRQTDRPLSMVAAECGYADQSHLGRAFKRRYGMSPAAWRARRHSV